MANPVLAIVMSDLNIMYNFDADETRLLVSFPHLLEINVLGETLSSYTLKLSERHEELFEIEK